MRLAVLFKMIKYELIGVAFLGIVMAGLSTVFADNWSHISTADGELADPTSNAQQVLTLILDINNDGKDDFVIGTRSAGPSLVWYRRDASGWTRHIIEAGGTKMEAGGAYYDIDGDGDLDVVVGANSQASEIWWWENPHPNHNPNNGWTRRAIKNSGSTKHHDMTFGDFDGDGKAEFAFWNQGASKLFLVEIPSNPTVQPWPGATAIFTAPNSQVEGMAQADVDGDGKLDIIGGGYWFKHTGGTNFTANLIEASPYIRVAAGQLIPGGRPEIVQVPGDANGPGRWFEWNGSGWVGRTLPGGTIYHGHSLDIGDVNGDGKLDIFVGEMRFPDGHQKSNRDSRTMIFLGDGAGNFSLETVATGYGNHESRLGDLDADGDLDILGKPFTWDTPRVDIWLNPTGGSPGPGPSPSPTATSSSSCTPLTDWDTHVIDAARPYKAVFVHAADVNGDGRQDIITGAWWYRNPGTPGGNWQRNTVGTDFNQVAVVADFDGDGDMDLMGTTTDTTDAGREHAGNKLVWARNNGGGTFEVYDNITRAADNADFLQGAIVESFGGSLRILLSWHNKTGFIDQIVVPANPATTQWSAQPATTVSQAEDLSAGDIDDDGDLDLLLGTMWLENNNGSWASRTLFNTTEKPDRNRLVDMDGDGDLDAVVGYERTNSSPGPLAWYQAPANPEGLWTQRMIDSTIIAPMSVDVGDIDGDGDPDVVAGEHHKNNPGQGRVFVYANNGNGTSFVKHLVATGDEHHDGTQLVDIDNDGDLDIISIGWTHGKVLLYEQHGCGGVRQPTPTPTKTPPPASSPTPTSTPPPNSSPTPTATPPPDGGSGNAYYLSSTTAGNAGGVKFADEDILKLDVSTNQWSLYFDGSDVGLKAADIDAFAIRADGSVLFSLLAPATLTGIGSVDDSDIVLFTPTSLGNTTSGDFELYFDGSDVDLTTNAEDIDGIFETPAGQLLITTLGKATVPGVKAQDKDILLFTPSGLGENTSGQWSLFFQGADIGLTTTSEDVRGIYLDGDDLYLTTQGAFQVGDISGTGADVFLCRLESTGTNTSCSGSPSIAWRGSQNGFGSEIIDGMWIEPAN